MPSTILGLDIGGANLKAATADKQAVTVPFALWKQPDRLPEVLAELVARFEGIEGFAITMTGELCDCFETRREGVNRILDAVEAVRQGWPVGVWSTAGEFVTVATAKREYLKIASANWHALATFAGRLVPKESAVLIDIGSTTTDVIPLRNGVPEPRGRTDKDRLQTGELVYMGVRRTPVAAIVRGVMAELFATVHDIYLLLGLVAEDPTDCDTADGRPSTRAHAHARLSRMLGGDPDNTPIDETTRLAHRFLATQTEFFASGVDAATRKLSAKPTVFLVSGSGEWLAQSLTTRREFGSVRWLRLAETIGPDASNAAPAYALAVLASERGLP